VPCCESISWERKYPRHIQANWFALFVKAILSLRYEWGSIWLVRGVGPQMILDLAGLDHALHADTTRELIVSTLPPRYRCPLSRLPISRLLLPRSGLERSDFVRWPLSTKLNARFHVRCLG
jgi:hypothetical protein